MVSKRVKVGAALLSLLVVAAVGAYAATVTIGDSGRFKTDSGLVVYGQGDVTVQSGNPFGSPTSVTIEGIRFNGSSAEARIDAFDSGGWTNLSQIQAESGRVGVDRPDEDEIGVSGTVDSVSVRAMDLTRGADQPDLVASAGGQWSLSIPNTGFQEETTVVVRDTDTDQPVGSAQVKADGSVTIDGLDSVDSAALDVEKGPSVLSVFNASQPTQLADGVTLTVRVFDQEGQVYQREVTDGTMPLSGIPTDQPLTITIQEDSTEKYVYRRTVIESVFDQQEVYLLSSQNTNVANVIFELDDRTGDYPPVDTILYVKRPVTKDFDSDGTNETRYQNVVGDTFGSGTFPTVLEANERYRLVVQNQQGQQRVIGSYTAQLDDRSTIRITGIDIPIDGDSGYAAGMNSFQQDTDDDGVEENYIRYTYRDPSKQTESLTWTLTSDKNDSTIEQGSTTGPLGTYIVTTQVPHSVENTSYELDWTGQREQSDGSDEEIGGTVWAGDVPNIPLPIDPQWLELLGIVLIVGMAGLVVIVDGAIAAVAATGTASILTVLGIVTIPLPALALGGVISIVAVIGRAR